MKLIGITGKARSGKDTAAKILCLNHGFVRMAFADPLKMAAQQMFGLTHAQTWDDRLKEVVIERWGKTPRQIFQLLGTECVKPFFGEDMWVRRLDLALTPIYPGEDVVITDVRFDAEADYIRSKGGIIVEIRRGAGLVGSIGDHASERGLSTLPEFVIDNTGTLEDLNAAIEGLVA